MRFILLKMALIGIDVDLLAFPDSFQALVVHKIYWMFTWALQSDWGE